MNDQQKKKYADEVNEIIDSRFEFINRYYLTIREAYHEHYDWPELDPLRHEISLCIMLGLSQAAITLTNHLLESLLKYALIITHGNNKKQKEEDIKGRIISSFIEKYKEGTQIYGDANLDKTINSACTVGLITKDQKKQLHQFRERFRNAYGHSDKKKTFGNSSIPVSGVRLENEKFVADEKGEAEIAEFFVGQGLVQAMMAQNDAPQYFSYIDKLVREIREKLFSPIDDKT
jgi:hypothetical protein